MGTRISLSFLDKYLMRFRLIIVICFHLLASILAYAASYYVRFDFKFPSNYYQIFLSTLPLIILTRLVAYYYYKTFSASWRFAYLRDFVDIFKAILLGSALFLALIVFLDKLEGLPRSVIFLEALLSLMIVGGTKLLARYCNEYLDEKGHKVLKNVFILGAGKAGVLFLNEIRSNKKLGINAVGFIDDDPYQKGRVLQGVPVVGNTEKIPELVKQYNIDEIIIAMPSSGYKDIARITKITENAGIKTMVIPSLGKLIQDGTFSNQLKEFTSDELLGRSVIKFSRQSDRHLLEEEINGNSVLITGAGGSIGSELCRQVALFHPSIMILYERHENALYDLEIEIRKEYPDQKILPVIGDVLDSEKLDKAIKDNSVNLIYHAAAYKHVPMMEREPLEAVRNNVFGTLNVAKMAIKNKVHKFVLISTDKAVNPANVMGTTKRIAELIIQKLNGKETKLVAVRFGNVLGSNGSVIPLFKKQIAEGGPVTVTHQDIRRFFMTIPEAVQLVMIAGAMGSTGGEIFLLDMGKLVKITDLASDLIRCSGLEPGKDIDIVITGLRPGEKLYEELFWQGEGIVPTNNKKITMLITEEKDCIDPFEKVNLLKDCLERRQVKEVLEILKEIVPEAQITCGSQSNREYKLGESLTKTVSLT